MAIVPGGAVLGRLMIFLPFYAIQVILLIILLVVTLYFEKLHVFNFYCIVFCMIFCIYTKHIPSSFTSVQQNIFANWGFHT